MNKIAKHSLRKIISTVIVSIAVLSLCALLISAQLYKSFVIDLEKIAVEDLVHIKLSDIHKELSRYSTELGIALQSEKSFRLAVQNNEAQLIHRFLNDHFHQYYVTASIIDLKKIFLLDRDYHYLYASSEGLSGTDVQNPVCRNVTERASKRSGADILKPISGICTFNDRSYYSVIVPVGTLHPEAYLQIITDPTFNLPELATAINSPIQVLYPDGTAAFTSTDWPDSSVADDYIFVHHNMRGYQGETVYAIDIAKDMSALEEGFRKTGYSVVLVSTFFMVLGLLVSAFIFRKSILALRQISSAAKDTSQGNYHRIDASGYSELDHVIDAYNEMTEKVKDHQEKLEAEIHSATEQLRQALDTVERRNKELETAIDMAQQANTTKSTFLANMSHELRTPLNAVIGYSELVGEELLESGQEHLCNDITKINSAGKHLLEIVNNILDLSKIEAGKIELELSQFNLADVIQQVIETVLPMANKKQLNIISKPFSADMPIYSDAVRVKQVMINLVNNAVKFTDQGSVEIRVERQEYLNKPVYLIAVEDTGIGIKSEEISKLFQAFHQVDESATRRYDGTGLGLALSKQLIEGLGGTINVESQFQQGSTFCIRIPLNLHN